MQSDVPPLPISCLTDNIRLRRNSNLKVKLTAQNNSNNSVCKSNYKTLISSLNRRQLRPIIARNSPYKNSARFNPPDTAKSSGKSVIDQRVSSAKMLRIKQLQNQLADAHFHLNELSNENKLLKAIQKRQDTALRRYEGTNAELPRIINSHQEDLRVLQTKYKKLKSQYKDTSDLLKEKENELHSLQVQNKKLIQLSKDRHLGEREKLQTQVFDLNHRINQQDEIIQTLKRKLALESKYLKHQLHVEMVKHRETQKQLQDTQIKLKSLEELTEQREKRAYHASRIIFFNKDKPTFTSQSLTNLNDSRSSNIIKGHSFRRRRSEAATDQSLPALNGASVLTRSQVQENFQKLSQETPLTMTETLMNFEQIRHFRLQKSPALPKATPFSTSRGSVRDSPIKESQLEDSDTNVGQPVSGTSVENVKKIYELPKSLKNEFGYASDDDTSKDDQLNTDEEANDSLNRIANRSRMLHARLVSSATERERTNKTKFTNRSRSLTKENMDDIDENDKEIKCDRDSVITVISKDMLKGDVDTATNCSNSDLESEIEIPVAFHADEDENVIRKSDINIDNSEIEKEPSTSSPLSKLFNQFYKPNYSFDSKADSNKTELNLKNNNDKYEFRLINGLLVHNELVKGEVDNSVDNIVIEKKSVQKENSKMLWNEDVFSEDSLKSSNEENSILDQIKNSNEETDDRNKAEKPFDDTSQNLNDTKQMESNLNNNKSPNKTNYRNSEKPDLKYESEQNTVLENTKAFDKAKLLAAMKAIDDNENIEIIEQKSRRSSSANRLQITENLYRGVPTHAKKKSDIMKELFADTKLDNNKNSKGN